MWIPRTQTSAKWAQGIPGAIWLAKRLTKAKSMKKRQENARGRLLISISGLRLHSHTCACFQTHTHQHTFRHTHILYRRIQKTKEKGKKIVQEISREPGGAMHTGGLNTWEGQTGRSGVEGRSQLHWVMSKTNNKQQPWQWKLNSNQARTKQVVPVLASNHC